MMLKNISLIIFLMCAPNICNAYEITNSNNTARQISQQEQELANQLLSLKVMLSKLRELLYNLKDIKELENAGLPHRDAELMYNTLLAKITQTKVQTLSLIATL